jgi:hypothetical protein
MRLKATSSRTATITVAYIATAMLMLDISIINTALSSIASGLNTGLGGLRWVLDAYALPLAATVLTAGAIADRLGRRCRVAAHQHRPRMPAEREGLPSDHSSDRPPMTAPRGSIGTPENVTRCEGRR